MAALLKPVILNARSNGRIVTSEAAVMAVPGSTTVQVNEFVAATVAPVRMWKQALD